jgi:hypothetical protein
MKNVITSIVVALGAIVAPVNAGTPPTVVAPTPVEQTSFGATAKVFATVVLNDSDESVGGGLALEVPVAGNLTAEIVGAVLEDEVYSLGGNLLYYVPVCEKASVYALAGGSYEFETDQWVVRAGGGVSYNLSPTVNLFADAAYNFTVEDSESDGAVSIRAGVGFKF